MKHDADTELDSHELDELAYAHAYKEHDDRIPYGTYIPRRIGPLHELLHLSLSGKTCAAESLLDSNYALSLLSEINQGKGEMDTRSYGVR